MKIHSPGMYGSTPSSPCFYSHSIVFIRLCRCGRWDYRNDITWRFPNLGGSLLRIKKWIGTDLARKEVMSKNDEARRERHCYTHNKWPGQHVRSLVNCSPPEVSPVVRFTDHSDARESLLRCLTPPSQKSTDLSTTIWQLIEEDKPTLFPLTKILYVMKPKLNILIVRGELPGVDPSRLVARFAL